MLTRTEYNLVQYAAALVSVTWLTLAQNYSIHTILKWSSYFHGFMCAPEWQGLLTIPIHITFYEGQCRLKLALLVEGGELNNITTDLLLLLDVLRNVGSMLDMLMLLQWSLQLALLWITSRRSIAAVLNKTLLTYLYKSHLRLTRF